MEFIVKDVNEDLDPVLTVTNERIKKIVCEGPAKNEKRSFEEKLSEAVVKLKERKKEIEEKEILKEEMHLQEAESYDPNKINWIEGDYYESWDRVKAHIKTFLGHNKDFNKDNLKEIFFLAAETDTIRGRPQLVGSVKVKIPLVCEVVKKIKKKINGVDYEDEIRKYFMLDEKFDARSERVNRQYCLDFWIYSVVYKGIMFYVYSDKKLESGFYELKGMIVERDDHAELSRSLKQKTITNVFILKSAEPSIKILSKEDLVTVTKQMNEQIGLDYETFLDFLAFNPRMNNFNRYSKDFEELRASVLLCGKDAGYPNHLFVWGTAGSLKTAHLECIYNKFLEEKDLIDTGIYAGSGRLTGLIPSFKSIPTDVGYLYKCNRIGTIDEFGKLLEKERNKHESYVAGNLAGDLNDAFDHVERFVGSGNSGTSVKSTAKYFLATNPVSGRETINSHVGLIDATWMSRVLHWVQDEEEQEFIRDFGIQKVPPTPLTIYPTKEKGFSPDTYTNIYTENWYMGREKEYIHIYMCRGDCNSNSNIGLDEGNFNPFMSIFDSCYSFLCEIDENQVEILNNKLKQLIGDSIMSSVWKSPRSLHHIRLVIDGLCKLRCLFKDHDASFTAKKADYDAAERILKRMVNSWNTNLQPKEDFR